MSAPFDPFGTERWNAARWTDEEGARAAEIYQRETAVYADHARSPPGALTRVLGLIADTLGRDSNNVYNRFRNYGTTFDSAPSRHHAKRSKPLLAPPTPRERRAGDEFVGHKHVPDSVLLERDARAKARLAQSATSAVLGDPPPGFSALDRKRASS